MKKSTFAPFKAVKVTCEVDWDLEDEDSPYREPKGYVPETVYTVDLKSEELQREGLMRVDGRTGEYVVDESALANSDALSDKISDDAGFCHNGYRVLKLTPVSIVGNHDKKSGFKTMEVTSKTTGKGSRR